MLLQIIHFPISKAPVEIQSERRVKREQIEVESDDGETGRVDDKEKQDLRFKKPRLQKALERTTTDEADDNVLEEDMKTFVGDDKVEKDKEEINSDNGLGGASKKEEATEENDVVPGGPDKAGEGDQIVREVEQPDNLVQLALNTDEDVEDQIDVEVGNDQLDNEQPGNDQPDVLEQADLNKKEVENEDNDDVLVDVEELFEPVVSILTEQLEAEDDGVNDDDVLDQPGMKQPDIKKPDSNEEEIEHDSAATDHVGKPVEGDQDIQALPSSSSAAEEKTFECIEVSDSDDDEEERGDDHIAVSYTHLTLPTNREV